MEVATNVICIDEGDYSSIMQDDGIHAIQRYTHEAYMLIATLTNATNAICKCNLCTIFS